MTDTRQLDTSARLVRETTAGPVEGVVEVRAVPFGEVLSMMGGLFREEFAPDVDLVLRDGQPLPMLWRHSEVIGSWSRTLDVRDDGVYAVGKVSDTSLGRDVKTLLADEATGGASIGFRPLDSRTEQRDGTAVEVITRAELLEISLTPLPAYAGAHVTAVREHPAPQEVPPMTATTPTVDYASRADVDQLRTDLEALQARAFAAGQEPRHWSHEFRSLYDYQLAVFEGRAEARPLSERAADTGLTSDNPGLVKAQWLSTVQRIVDLGRPGIAAFGTAPLPDSGLTFQWPTYTAGAHTAAQPTGQVNELTSVAVDVGASSAVTIGTYGGYMRAAYQLLQRSDPSFRAVWEQAVSVNYANVVDNVFVDALASAATGSVTGFDFSGSVDADDLRGALFAASVKVETATGLPAEFVLVATDVFNKVGTYALLPDNAYGAGGNAEGTSRASTLRVEVSGLPIIHERNLANGTILVSNSSAAKWHEQGPNVVTQEQVSLLAQDMAIYGYGVTAAYVPTGLVKITAA